MFHRVLAFANVDGPEGQGYSVLISLIFPPVFPSTEPADFLFSHRPLLHRVLLALGDKIQDGLKMEKPGALHHSGFSDGDTSEFSIRRALIQTRPAEA